MSRLVLGGVACAALFVAPVHGPPHERVVSANAASVRDGCPTGLLTLGSNPVAAASRAALRAEKSGGRPRVTGAAVATTRFDRSSQVGTRCGQRAAARSVVVTIHRRAYDSGDNRSASLSQGTVVVARFRSGWRVWSVLH